MEASGIAFLSGGTVLLVKRTGESDFAGHWAFPGGKVEEGETIMSAALRECMEEVGQQVTTPLHYGYRCEGDGIAFTTFINSCDKFTPVLNEEHDAFLWADMSNLPAPLHPGAAEAIANIGIQQAYDSAQAVDHNGFVTIERNPISRAGVFPYSGRTIAGADPSKIYMVYRPAEELAHPEAIASFRLVPFLDEHAMVGVDKHIPAESYGVHGTTGQDVFFEGGVLYSSLRVFSKTMRSLIAAGKKALSLGYNCTFEKCGGVFEGVAYDYIQRNLRGNHIALVERARCDVAVLDSREDFAFDNFDLETGDSKMADEETKADEGTEKKKMTVEELKAVFTEYLPEIKEMMAAIEDVTETLAETDLDAETAVLDKDDKEEKKEDKAMDAVTALEQKFESKYKSLESGLMKKVMADVSSREKLAREVAPLVGVFDHSEMTAQEVAQYAVKKLGIQAQAGAEAATLQAYIAGRAAANPAVGFAMDGLKKKEGGLLAKTLAATA